METVKTWENYFPYEPRPLQDAMIKVMSKMIERRVHMVFEAANGTGKTITALSAFLPYAKSNDLKIVYLARTHTQMDRVIEELQEISKIEPVSGIALRGRSSMCLNKMVMKYANSNRAVAEMCQQLKSSKRCDYFTNMGQESRLMPVVNELSRKPVTAEIVLDMAEAAHVCPAETGKLLLSKVDVVACSYLYIFDPGILPSFLDGLGCELEDIVLIVDECHNLPDNVNSITSDDLSTYSFTRAMREARDYDRLDFIDFFQVTSDYLVSMTKNQKVNQEQPVDPAIFLEEIYFKLSGIEVDEKFFEEMVKLGLTIRYKLAKQGKEPRSSVGRIGEFFSQWFYSIGKVEYTHSVEKKRFTNTRDNFVTLRLDSLDPSIAILPILRKVNLSLSMSGSLGDPEAFGMLTGIDQLRHMSNILPSPYDKKNIQALVPARLTTQYKQRSREMWLRMNENIASVVNNTPANVGLFTPSYKILNDLLDNGLEDLLDKPVVTIESGMSSGENDAQIKRYKNYANKGGALLCSVLGGRTSEGADFPGDLMNSVIIVGIPYAPPNCRIDAQIKYLDDKFPGRGRLLAYQIPAINRASQAAGRPVRGLSDRAFILLLDYRFSNRNVAIHLPGWLRSSLSTAPDDPSIVGRHVNLFFNGNH